MDPVLLLIFSIVNTVCISLYLPSNDRESPHFTIVQDIEYSHTPYHPAMLIHFTITYESKTDDIINEIYYYGAQIFHDKGHDPPPERRIVTYTMTGRQVIISVHPSDIDTSVDTNYFEAQYFIDHDGVYDIAHNVPSGIHIVNNNPNSVKEHELLAFLTKKDMEHEIYPIFPSKSIFDFITTKLFSRFFRNATSNEPEHKYEKASELEDDYQLRGNAEGEDGALVEVNAGDEAGQRHEGLHHRRPGAHEDQVEV
ncbi:conserved hypothetical protein [Theileria orientalis strain Shintoku]|uniref:Uncharacterized protein n=1 Tax=Theileria orientalis strain Shintoku TaxID=869250 RepID=J4DPN7_THEOR|nr:conserved hypothetical protein [Theileria orientalis strain Shintoku]BAM41024.1 conserved hypothetical protein [Theileria orientalis strain Shintoku]|eukprot:XP_009691325.1 conserved hypothetical protein [Theileria orientalis strain Shintoku]